MHDYSLGGKKIILAVTGSIAAYKAVVLCRLLIKSGAQVKVVMTPSAAGFVTPLTFETLSGHPVQTGIQDDDSWNNHVELGLWADCLLVAPCTANTLSKMAHGMCDNLLTAIYLSARCRTVISPAMDVDMWLHPTTKRNITLLEQDGCSVLAVGNGFLASGLDGPGRMLEPEAICEHLYWTFQCAQSSFLSGKKCLVTAGPTYESLDPVRFLGNWSSGRMGISIAKALAYHGAHVDLVLGPTSLQVFDHPNIRVQRTTTALEMYQQCLGLWTDCHIGVMAAAVSDYRPKTKAKEKLKKKDDDLVLELERNPDIAQHLGAQKNVQQALVGFALETTNGIANATKKIIKKNLDFIVLNNPKDDGAGFQTNTNKVTFVFETGDTKEIPLKTKNEVAVDIVLEIEKLKK